MRSRDNQLYSAAAQHQPPPHYSMELCIFLLFYAYGKQYTPHTFKKFYYLNAEFWAHSIFVFIIISSI